MRAQVGFCDIYRTDRPTHDHRTKHGGVLIGVRDIPHKPLCIKTQCECFAVKLTPKTESIIVCCIYNAPEKSPYRICQQRILDLINELIAISENENYNSLVITGDINL